jgi:hypothetical protein
MRKWIVADVVVLLVPLVAALLMGPTLHSFVRERTQKVLQTHFASMVEFSDFDVDGGVERGFRSRASPQPFRRFAGEDGASRLPLRTSCPREAGIVEVG